MQTKGSCLNTIQGKRTATCICMLPFPLIPGRQSQLYSHSIVCANPSPTRNGRTSVIRLHSYTRLIAIRMHVVVCAYCQAPPPQGMKLELLLYGSTITLIAIRISFECSIVCLYQASPVWVMEGFFSRDSPSS